MVNTLGIILILLGMFQLVLFLIATSNVIEEEKNRIFNTLTFGVEDEAIFNEMGKWAYRTYKKNLIVIIPLMMLFIYLYWF